MTKKILKNFLVYFLHYHFFYYICIIINETMFIIKKKDKSLSDKPCGLERELKTKPGS